MKTIFAILMMCLSSFANADGHLEGEKGQHVETEAGSAITPRTGSTQTEATRVKRKATPMRNSQSNSRWA